MIQMKKFLPFLAGVLFLSASTVSCSKSDDPSVDPTTQNAMDAEFKVTVLPVVESNIEYIRFMTATSTDATFYTKYTDSIIDIRKVNQAGKIELLIDPLELKDFAFTHLKLEDKITLDNNGNFYTILTNKNQPNVKTVWKYDATRKTVVPFANVSNGDLQFISYWPAQNKLVVQDDSNIYTLGLNEAEDELTFFIGGPNSSTSQPKDGVGADASVALNFPISYFDQTFFFMEKNRFIRQITAEKGESQVKTLSVFAPGANAYLTMISPDHFFVDRKNPEVGLAEGSFVTQEMKTYFFANSTFYGYSITYKGKAESELLVSTAMHVILGGEKNGVKLYTMNSYLPAGDAIWSADKKSIVYVRNFLKCRFF